MELWNRITQHRTPDLGMKITPKCHAYKCSFLRHWTCKSSLLNANRLHSINSIPAILVTESLNTFSDHIKFRAQTDIKNVFKSSNTIVVLTSKTHGHLLAFHDQDG